MLEEIRTQIKNYADRLHPLSLLALIMLDFLEFGVTATMLGLSAPISLPLGAGLGFGIVLIIQLFTGKKFKDAFPDSIIAAMLLAVPFPVLTTALGLIKVAGKK